MIIINIGSGYEIRMTRPKEIKGSPRQVSLNLENKLYTEFEKTLPKGKSVSEAIREYMQETLDERKKGEASLQRLPIISGVIRQTSITEYTYIYLQKIAETPDELLEQTVRTLTPKQGNLIYDKFCIINSTLFDMEHPTCH